MVRKIINDEHGLVIDKILQRKIKSREEGCLELQRGQVVIDKNRKNNVDKYRM